MSSHADHEHHADHTPAAADDDDEPLEQPDEEDDDHNDAGAADSATGAASTAAAGPDATTALSADDRTRLETLRQLFSAMGAPAPTTLNKSEDGEKKANHKFWSTQPVMDYGDDEIKDGAIEPDKKPEEIRPTPYALPQGFEWSEIDVNNDEELKELYELLSLNYVEDEDAMFRFDYSAQFLRWALQPPGWLKSWHPGVRVTTTKKLVGFISAIPADIRVYDHHQIMVEINFLCVHKKLRTKRLAPVLIKEITRRVHLQNIFQATYTAGIHLPRPVTSCRYYHRNLNPKKLIDTGFSHLPRNLTMAGTIKLYKLPETTKTPGLRAIQPKDVKAVTKLLGTQLSLYKFAPVMTEAEVQHYFLTREGVVYSYVVQNPSTGAVTDFVSFYSLPSSVIRHPVHKCLNAAYLYYYAVSATPLKELIQDALILAKQLDFDVFNCLDLMENSTFVEDLKFGIGDGTLQFYLYNWACKRLKNTECGMVLL